MCISYRINRTKITIIPAVTIKLYINPAIDTTNRLRERSASGVRGLSAFFQQDFLAGEVIAGVNDG
jgi:hypothetical protein